MDSKYSQRRADNSTLSIGYFIRNCGCPSNKYAGSDTAVDYLAKKIITGGSGVWGEIMMAPHPSLSEEDAKTLARYILLMKK